MIYSPNFHFNIPSRDVDDIVDINQLSENFMQIDAVMVAKEEGKGLSSNDYTDEDKEKLDSLSFIPDVDLSGKQDKFADVTEEDGVVTVTSTVSDDRPPQAILKNGELELQAMFLKFGDGQGEVSLNGFNAPDDSLNINANDNRIRNLANPIFEGDAVNKVYLDGVVGQIEAALDNIIALQNSLIGGNVY